MNNAGVLTNSALLTGKVTDWRTWYWKRNSWQRWNMEKSGHGIRIISP